MQPEEKTAKLLQYFPISILQRRERQPTPVFLPGKAHQQRSLEGYTVQGVAKSQT